MATWSKPKNHHKGNTGIKQEWRLTEDLAALLPTLPDPQGPFIMRFLCPGVVCAHSRAPDHSLLCASPISHNDNMTTWQYIYIIVYIYRIYVIRMGHYSTTTFDTSLCRSPFAPGHCMFLPSCCMFVRWKLCSRSVHPAVLFMAAPCWSKLRSCYLMCHWRFRVHKQNRAKQSKSFIIK